MNKLIIIFTTFVIYNVYGSNQISNQMIQNTMIEYVNNNISKNKFFTMLHEGKILQLSLLKTKKYPTGFHQGVKTLNNLFVSCADFKDKKGNTYDVDFLVSTTKNAPMVIQPIIHSINGKKNPYDIEH